MNRWQTLGARLKFVALCGTALCLLLIAVGPSWANPQRGLGEPPLDLDRSTPLRSVESFQTATGDGQFLRAAFMLDLRLIAKDKQSEVGPDLARKLRFVLDQTLPLQAVTLSNEEAGNPDDGPGREKVGEIKIEELRVPIELQLVSDGKGGAVWLFSANTVRSIPTLYERAGPGWFGDQAPAWSFRHSLVGLALWQLFSLALVAFTAVICGWLVAHGTLWLSRRIINRTANVWDDAVVQRLQGPCTLLLGVIFTDVGVPLVRLTAYAEARVGKVTQLVAILATTWLVVRIVRSLAAVALQRADSVLQQVDEVVRHGQRTRVVLMRQVGVVVVYFVGVSLALTQFDSVRQVGVSLLASAGVVGVVVGIAAQKSVANLLAGIQISWAQPIRIGDRVRILDDVGWIEEVTLTYVAMKTWDGRRRMFPITYFTDNHFENWSRTDQSKVAVVTVHADYALPVENLRAELPRWLDNDPDSEGSEFGLVVFDALESTILLRFTAPAADATRAFNLACRVREKIVAYLQTTDDGRYLPRRRVSAVDGDLDGKTESPLFIGGDIKDS
jgi:small-conductance mechanosensitive channel